MIKVFICALLPLIAMSMQIIAGDFEIMKVEYGNDGYWRDVTAIARPKLESEGRILATNALFGDPAFAMPKRLRAIIKVDGKLVEMSARESDTLTVNAELARKAPPISSHVLEKPGFIDMANLILNKSKGFGVMRYEPIVKNFPHILHGGDYNPEQWRNTPGIIDEDFRLMNLAGCNAFSVGIFSWSALEPEEVKYDFAWLDRIMDRMDKEGKKVFLATPSGARPPWMAIKYPEVMRAERNGARAEFHARHNHCWSSPVYREKVVAINRLLAERYKNHPALAGWHVSNEYSSECFCNRCIGEFRLWLKEKYKTIDNLNTAWWSDFWSHRYSDWNQINPRDNGIDAVTLDWKRFLTWQCCEFMRMEVAPLKKIAPGIPVTTNMMSLNDVGIDYWRLAEVCDFISDDCYPCWDSVGSYFFEAARLTMTHDMHRSMKNGRPFLMMESAPSSVNWQTYYRVLRPNVHQMEMLLALGHGADGTMFFQWRKSRGAWEKFHGAAVDHSGSPETRVFKEVSEVGRIEAKLDSIVGTSTPVEVAVIHDWEIRWAINASCGPTSGNKNILETIIAHYRALFGLNVPMDVIESNSDFSKYKVLVAPMLFMLKPGVAERLERFVANGGTLVCTYLSAYVNENNLCYTGGMPGGGLRKVFGIWNEDLDGFTPQDSQAIELKPGNRLGLSGEFKAVEFAERLHLEGAEVIAGYKHEFYAREPAVTVNLYGKGKAYYIATRTGDDFLIAFYRQLSANERLASTLPPENPWGVHGQIRSDGKKVFLFVYNFNRHPVEAKLPPGRYRDMSNGNEISSQLPLSSYGSVILEKL